MEYRKTKGILRVERLLGRKRIKSTEIYTHPINFQKEEYHIAHAGNLYIGKGNKTEKGASLVLR